MATTKERVTVTLDPPLLAAANAAVAAGQVASISAWVNRALVEQVAKEKRRAAMGRAIADYEAELGAFTPEELETQRLADQRNAIKIRRTKPRSRGARTR